METFALVKFEECFPSHFVMPWLIRITLFHGRKDMDQPFGLACFGDDLLDAVIFTESTEFTDEFNFNTIFISNALCILSDLFRKRLRKI